MRYDKEEMFNYITKITTPKTISSIDETVKMYVPCYDIMHNMKNMNIPFLSNFNSLGKNASIHMFLRSIKDEDPSKFTPFTVLLALSFLFTSDSSYDNKYTRILNCDDFWLFIAKTSRISFLFNLTDEDDEICGVKNFETTIRKITVPSIRDFTYRNKIVITDTFLNYDKTLFNGFPFKNILRFLYHFSHYIMMREIGHDQLNPMLTTMQKLYGVCYRYDEMEYTFSGNNSIKYVDAVTPESQVIEMDSSYSVIDSSEVQQTEAINKLTTMLNS